MSDLTRISGIGAATAKVLKEAGIATLQDLAAIEPEGEKAGQLGIRPEWIAAAAKKVADAAAAGNDQDNASPAASNDPVKKAKPATAGLVAKQEIRLGGKTYGPGAKLPAGIDEDTIATARALGAI